MAGSVRTQLVYSPAGRSQVYKRDVQVGRASSTFSTSATSSPKLGGAILNGSAPQEVKQNEKVAVRGQDAAPSLPPLPRRAFAPAFRRAPSLRSVPPRAQRPADFRARSDIHGCLSGRGAWVAGRLGTHARARNARGTRGDGGCAAGVARFAPRVRRRVVRARRERGRYGVFILGSE